MTRIESRKVEVSTDREQVFDFLSNFNNFEKLMPEQVGSWESDGERCSFEIKGMTSLGMAYASKDKPGHIRIIRDGKAPFDFSLDCLIDNVDKGTGLQLVFEADLNPMLKMMAVKPLTNFLNMLVDRFSEIADQNDLSEFIQK
jgi:carbon monoxide dehydrogenase subunit G